MKRDRVVHRRTTKKDEDVIGADRNAVIQAIRAARTRAGLTQEAAAALTRHATSTISRWETGGLPNKWDDLIEYAHAMNQTIVLEFGEHQEAAAPIWAAEMEERLTGELVRNRELIEALAPADIREAAARVIERLEALPPQGDEGQRETDGEEGQGAAAPPGPGPGSRRGRVVG